MYKRQVIHYVGIMVKRIENFMNWAETGVREVCLEALMRYCLYKESQEYRRRIFRIDDTDDSIYLTADHKSNPQRTVYINLVNARKWM